MVIRDPIHGDIDLPRQLKPIIDHTLVQRLRYVGQTGLLFLVFPGMRHSRFEHSLGACNVALEWFQSLRSRFVPKTEKRPLLPEGDSLQGSGVRLLFKETNKLYRHLFSSSKCKDTGERPWRLLFSAAALLHDVGHGPFSHTLEHDDLDILKRENYLDGTSTRQIKEFIEIMSSHEFKHEAISVIYIDKVFQSLRSTGLLFSSQNCLLVCGLVHPKFRKYLIDHFKQGYEWGLEHDDLQILELLSPLISGLFDVDRLDYIRRDALMAGVPYGQIEHQRMIRALVPILIQDGQKRRSALVARSRKFHLLDHFLIALYEMYTQVLYHPTAIQYEHELIVLVSRLLETNGLRTKDFDINWHRTASDSSFVDEINASSRDMLKDILARKYRGETKQVHQVYFPGEVTLERGWNRIEIKARDLVKGSQEVWLVESNAVGVPEKVFNWSQTSVVASKLRHLKFMPQIWWNNRQLRKALDREFPLSPKKQAA